MFYGNTVQEVRQVYFSAWHKYQKQEPLSALEQQIISVLLAHPEYHSTMDNMSRSQEQNYYPELGETNPFLHMGLHLAVREQIATDRPAGIAEVYKNLVKKHQDPLDVEHIMMDQLAECLWIAQKNRATPDEQLYLKALRDLI